MTKHSRTRVDISKICHQYDLIGLSPILPLADLNHDRWLAPEQAPIVVLEPWLWKGWGSLCRFPQHSKTTYGKLCLSLTLLSEV